MSKCMRIVGCLALVIAAVAVSGCSSEPKDPFKDWDAGMKYENFVPPSAQPVASGTGVLTYTVPANGTLYLLDTTNQVNIQGVMKPTVLITGYVPKGTEVTFDPATGRVHGKGREGMKLTQVDPTHTHELRFEPVDKKPA